MSEISTAKNSFRLVGYGIRETPESAADRLVRFYGSARLALESHLAFQSSSIASTWSLSEYEPEFWGHEDRITKELESRVAA